MTDSIFDITQHCVRVDLNEEISSFNFSFGVLKRAFRQDLCFRR